RPPPLRRLLPYTTHFRSHHEIAIIVGNFEPRTTGMRRHEMHRLAPRVIPRFRHRPHAVTPPSTPTHDRRAVINGDLVQASPRGRSEEHTSELQSRENLVC